MKTLVRATFGALATALLISGCAIFGVQSSMSCVGPTFTVAPEDVVAGETVRVALSDAITECRDTGGGSVGWAEGVLEVAVTPMGETAAALTAPMEVAHGAGETALDTAGLAAGTSLVGVDGGLDIAVLPVTLTVTAG